MLFAILALIVSSLVGTYLFNKGIISNVVTDFISYGINTADSIIKSIKNL